MYNHEIYGMKRLIAYIENVSDGHSVRPLSDQPTIQKDFKNFYTQYSKRRNMDFDTHFADWPELVDWVNGMGKTHTREVPNLIKGDTAEWGEEIVNGVLKKYGK